MLDELVIRVDDERRVEALGRQARVVFLSAHDLDIGDLRSERRLQLAQADRIDVDRVDASLRADRPGETRREKSTAGADVGDMRAGHHAELAKDVVDALPLLA